jgi:methionyl-tRNA synthetase
MASGQRVRTPGASTLPSAQGIRTLAQNERPAGESSPSPATAGQAQPPAGAQPPPAAAPESASTPTIDLETFRQADLRVAEIVAAEPVEGATRLLRLEVDLGSERRQLVAGIAAHYTPEQLVGRKIVVVANLAPARIRGVESRGMLLAAGGRAPDAPLSVLTVDAAIPNGTRVE